MQQKWIVVTLMAAALSWIAAGAAFAAPIAHTRVEIAPQIVGTPLASGGGVFIAPQVTNTITSTVTPTATLSPGNQKIANAIAKYFSVTVDIVEDIHDQAHGWGQVFLVFMLADKTGEDPQKIWDMRDEGQGWGTIFTDLGVKHGLHGNNLGSAVTGKAKPSPEPSVAAPNSQKNSNDDKDCKGNPNNNGKGNPCLQTSSTPPASNSSNNNGNGNGNNNGNGNRGKSGK